MKTAKGLLLGTAAGIVAFTGAQAADLPLAEPVQYVRICDTFGRGYFYIPGSQTCLQISGLARAQFQYEEPFTRGDSAIATRLRARINMDMRTRTEWGTLRAFIRLQADWRSDVSRGTAGADPITAASTQVPGDNATKDNSFYAESAFIQFAGLTAGFAKSFFDQTNYATFNGIFSDQSIPVLAWTQVFGGGFSATLSLEDRAYRERGINGTAPAPGGGIAYAGQTMPDVVGALGYTGAWGSARLSGALHQVRGLNGLTVNGETEHGYALQASIRVNLPMIAAGDYIWVQGAWARGALKYTDLGGNTPQFTGVGVAAASDAYYLPANGGLSLTESWTLGGGFTHFWTPSVRTNFGFIYGDIDVPSFAVQLAGANRVQDHSQIYTEANLVWSPVRDLDLGVAVFYRRFVDTQFPVAQNDRWGGILRVQRNF